MKNKRLAFPKKIRLAGGKSSVKDLDDLFREFIRFRDKMTCQHCGKKDGKLEVAHFYSRAKKSVRWDPSNAALLCFLCHYCWGHREPPEFTAFWIRRLGKIEFSRLTWRAHDTSKLDRNAVRLFLEAELKKLKGE